MTPENDIMRRLQKLASTLGARLFRQNAGMGWTGKVMKGPGVFTLGPNDIVIRNARPFHAGHEGLSDLGGWVPVKIEPDHVGTTLAVYLQVEVKTSKGRATEPQKNWIAAVRRAGGRAGIARTDDDLRSIVENNQPPLL